MKYKKGLMIISILVCILFMISCVSAADDIAGDANQTVGSDDDQVILEQDSSEDEALTVENDEDILGATSHIYFDASASFDGDGSQSKPYKYYDTDKIPFGATVHFKKGTYNIQSTLSISSSLSYKTTFIGEGQNTILKSSGSILGFKIRDNSNFVLQGLTIECARINNNGNLEATNVLFKNADSRYSQIYSITTSVSPTVKLTGCSFQNNHAIDLGGSITLYSGSITLDNCNFYNSVSDKFGGAIELKKGTLNIRNSRFDSSESKHGGAIYALHSTISITGTTFYNCKSEGFGGVISAEYGSLIIDSCNFTNCLSIDDGGGAIYVMDGNSDVKNSVFVNNSAYFGGSICNLNSGLNISSSEFDDDHAEYYGGSIYNMFGDVNLVNNRFYNSWAGVSGGAIIARFSNSFNINSNSFIRTYAKSGPVIFIDGDEDYVHIIENNNVYRDLYNFVAVYRGLLNGNKVEATSNYLTFSVSSDGTYIPVQGDDSTQTSPYVDLNILSGGSNVINTDLDDKNMIQFNIIKKNSDVINENIEIYLIDAAGNRISYGIYALEDIDYLNANLFNITFKDYLLNLDYQSIYYDHPSSAVPFFNFSTPVVPTSLNSSYDSRDFEYITPVKNQGSGGNCWAFGGIATLEACLKKATGITFDFSEENVKNLMAEYSLFGWNPNQGGYDYLVWGYLASWFGPVYDVYDIYDEYSALSVLYNPVLHIQDIYALPDIVSGDFNAVRSVKEAVVEYGAVTMTTLWTDGGNHCMSIVGWDDNYRGYDHFGSYAQGAWIVKNSYGPEWGYDGYLYISYSRKIFDLYTFIFAPQINEYSDIYQYDYGGMYGYSGYNGFNYYKNKFTSKGSDILSAVSTYFERTTDYTIKVYIKGVLNTTQSGVGHNGYNVIHLDNEIQLAEGDEFEVEFCAQNSWVPMCKANYHNRETFNSGLSFWSSDGQHWSDLYTESDPRVACIKAFTRPAQLEEFEVNFKDNLPNVLQINKPISFIVELPSDVQGLVTFTINGKNYYVEAKDGKAILNITFSQPRSYNMNVHYESSLAHSNNISFNFEVSSSVQSVITCSVNDIEKYYGGPEKFTATLFDSGIRLAGKDVNVRVDGKIYAVKTNSEGEISLDLNLQPGIYTVFTYYESKIFSSKFTVKSTIGAVDTSGEFMNTFVNATFMDSQGQLLQKGKAIFMVDGDEFIGDINASGFSSIEIDLGSGNYTMTITNPVTHEQVARNLFIDRVKPGFFTVSIYQYGYIVSIYADLPFNANGYVTLECGGKRTYAPIDKRGYTTLQLDHLPVGEHVLTAYYEGDDNYRGIYLDDTSFTVNETNIEITAYNSSFYYNHLDPSKYNIRVKNNGVPVHSGDVVVTIDGFKRSAPCKEGNAYILVLEKPGIYQANIEYGGVNITREIHVKSTVIANDTFTGEYGKSMVFATFLDSHGNLLKNQPVTFYVGGTEYHATTDGNGYMIKDVEDTAGSHEVVFINPITGEEFKALLNITKSTPQIGYVLDERSDSYSFKGIVSQATGGSLVYTFGGKAYVVNYRNGFSDLIIHTDHAGEYTVDVRFTGDANLNAASQSFTFNLENKADIIISYNVVAGYGQNNFVSVTLMDSDGYPKAYSRIAVIVNGATTYLTTNYYGSADYLINLNAGTYTIQLRSDNYGYKTISAVVKKSTPVLKASAKTFKLKVKTKKYKVTFNLPKRYLNHYKLTLKVKGKTYKAFTNSKGQATFKINKLKKKGTFKATIKFAGDANLNRVTKTVKIKVK